MTQLKRSLTLTLTIFYGLGTILGAGIYVLTGLVADKAGYLTPLSFVLAAVLAGLTGFSYAELSARFPKSAGEAVYVKEAFDFSWLSRLMGLAVVFVGTCSAATIANGFVGYLNVFIELDANSVVFFLVLALGALAFYGVLESVATASVITLIEVIGLIIVIGVSVDSLAVNGPQVWNELQLSSGSLEWSGVFAGAFLAFFAFIGFEDIVNIAEEVENPSRNLPLAVFWSLGLATVLYFLVALVAVTSVPIEELAGHESPMALIVAKNGGLISPQVIAFIGMLAMVNGALVQIIMGSRVFYGLAKDGLLPKYLSHVHPKRRTPSLATLITTLMVMSLALTFNLEKLASLTSFITLSIFALVNLALLVIRFRFGKPKNTPAYPIILPALGFICCMSLLIKVAMID